jgi:hypothetical protein
VHTSLSNSPPPSAPVTLGPPLYLIALRWLSGAVCVFVYVWFSGHVALPS